MFAIHCLKRALYYKPAYRNLILALHCVSQLRANNSLPEPVSLMLQKMPLTLVFPKCNNIVVH